jgi:hypothetical protein
MSRPDLDTFENAPQILRRAVADIPEGGLKRRTSPGLWSVQECVIHVADSDAILIDRMRRILTEENPTFFSADETAYIERLFPHEQSLEDAFTLLELGRSQMARTLRLLPDEAFDRMGTHNLAGPVTLGDLVEKATRHLERHAKFIAQKRASLVNSA